MSEAVAERPKRIERTYTDAQKDAALVAYVRCSGHVKKASQLLAAEGQITPWRTLEDWAKKIEVPRLERIRQELEPLIKREAAETHQGLLKAAAEIEMEAIEGIKERLGNGEGDLKDLSAVAQRSAIATGIHSEKHLLYSGEPTQIVKQDAAEVMRKLASRGMRVEATERKVVIESDA
jgi:hypothetical protein